MTLPADKTLNLDDPGWLAVLEAGETGRVWMKVSGSCRPLIPRRP